MSLDMDYQIFVPVVSASDVFDVSEIILPATIEDKKTSCTGIYDENTFILLLYTENPGVVIHEIGLYNSITSRYEKMFAIAPGQVFEICAYNTSYVVLRISEDDWKMTSIYVYDFANRAINIAAKYSYDDETEAVYYQNNNTILLLQDQIFFDDFSKDKSGNIISTLYKHSIENRQTELFAENAQNPMRMNGEIVYFTYDDNGEYKRIASNKGIVIDSVQEALIEIAPTGTAFFCIENKLTDEEARTTLFQLTNITTGEGVLATHAPIGRLKANHQFVGWTAYNGSVPCVYDIEKNVLVNFDEIQEGVTTYYLLVENYGIVLNTVDGVNRFFRFSYKKT